MKSPVQKAMASTCTVAVLVLLAAVGGRADDTCMFYVSAGKVPPNIVLLLDNGAEMQRTVYHPDYDSGLDFTPLAGGLTLNGQDDDSDGDVDEADEDDLIKTGGSGSGFFNTKGYGIVEHGGEYFLVIVQDDLQLADYRSGIRAATSNATTRTGIWTFNGKTVTLPAEASAAVDGDGIKDNAGSFRYAGNYLNWIFYSGIYTGNGSDLPRVSRFYNAKKAILTVGKLTSNQAEFGIYNFANVEGASQVQPLQMVVDTIATLPENNDIDVEFVNNINNMGTVVYSPLAEGLATVGGYYDSPASHVVGYYCQKNFVIVITPGMSSMDRNGANQYLPQTFSDYDGDSGDIGEGNVQADAAVYTIPTNLDGTSWLDDVAHYMYNHDMVSYQDGFQNVRTFTVGFMGDLESNLFLVNTSNNGNGNPNLYNTSHEEYGKYHFVAESPEGLTATLLAAVNSIISQTMTYTAPVVPVTRTISSDKIYMSLFKPLEGNFWEGNVVKFGLDDQQQIIDSLGSPAAWSNGALKKDAKPFWATRDWADTTASNGILNSSRNIYTYLGASASLADSSNLFDTANSDLTTEMLDTPSITREQLIDFIRGADVFDEDSDGNTTENRENITGDVLHSEPLIVHYNYPDKSMKSMVFFGSNDGMLHAVLDMEDPDVDVSGNETDYGTEAWAFIPPDQLHRLKDIVEGLGHQYFVDSSPKAYIRDVNGNGLLETTVDSDQDGDVDADDKDQVIIVCGERKGGFSYFALDVTDPAAPKFLWRIAPDSLQNPEVVIPELGQTWSEPQFGQVKTSNTDTAGIPVLFIGAGFSADNTTGTAVLAINVMTGEVVKKFANGSGPITQMNYSVVSTVKLVDENDNGFVDKVYVGDLGGQMWRIGQFATDPYGNPLVFFETDENIYNWTAEVLFRAPTYVVDATTHTRKFYYAASVTLERGYDLVLMGTGDREDPCNQDTAVDRIYCVKDDHTSTNFEEADLVDVTDASDATPNLEIAGDVDENGHTDKGWYIRLEDSVSGAAGEKVLAKGTVFYKTYYVTTFTPNDDPCVPGGSAKVYALNYKTGAAVLSFGGSTLTRYTIIGGGIPSNPVPIITSYGQKLFVSIGSTMPTADSQSVEAGVIRVTPLSPEINFHYLWWREL